MTNKTHYIDYWVLTGGGKEFHTVHLTTTEYESIVFQKTKKSNNIVLPNKFKTHIDWKQIAVIEMLSAKKKRESESKSGTEGRQAICNDCGMKVDIDQLPHHTRACATERQRQWEKRSPKKAAIWKKICAKIFAERDERKKERIKASVYKQMQRGVAMKNIKV